ncbi:MAG TPA: GNAT family N-acetyltransferase [Burkholderiaceae bacterium]|nr:GNAT family N-acetyltransferase [Burkholderiaceae bacterium]
MSPSAALPVFDRDRLRWRWCLFDALSVHELQAIFRARLQVFAIEQQCVYQDIDGVDAYASHLAAWAGDEASVLMPLAYARVVQPGVKYAEPSIGRVLTTDAARGIGLGRELVRRAIAQCRETYPGRGIRISAQSRLERFYGGFGFVAQCEPYLEDGIPHTEMLLPA